MGIMTQKATVTSWQRHRRDIKIFKIKLKKDLWTVLRKEEGNKKGIITQTKVTKVLQKNNCIKSTQIPQILQIPYLHSREANYKYVH
jgi:hypothetical protein